MLQQAVAADYQIFAKVRLADIVRPVHNRRSGAWQSAFNRVSSKHVDFVLCAPANMRVLIVIELDDRTHDRSNRKDRDTLVNSALADACIPLLRISAKPTYSPAQLREQLAALPRPEEAIRNLAG